LPVHRRPAGLRYPEAVGRLPELTSLRFGPRRVDDAKILSAIGVHRLLHFTLAGTPTPAIDLSPLADARSLRSLRLLGYGKNTEAIGHVTSLCELALQHHRSSRSNSSIVWFRWSR